MLYISTGVVLGRHGGMIQQIFMPFYLGVGGPIGSGKQYFPWIHIDDIVNLFIFAIENEEVSGGMHVWTWPLCLVFIGMLGFSQIVNCG